VARRLQEAGWGIKFISHVENHNKQKLQNRPWFNTTFSKLHVFGLTEFDKIVYLDADLLLLSNIDALFDALPLEGHTDSLEDRPFAAASEVFPPDTFNSGEFARTGPCGTACAARTTLRCPSLCFSQPAPESPPSERARALRLLSRRAFPQHTAESARACARQRGDLTSAAKSKYCCRVMHIAGLNLEIWRRGV